MFWWLTPIELKVLVADPNRIKELMGHRPGEEYRKLASDYLSGKMSMEEFLAKYRNPANYQPESPSSNRSRVYEQK